VRWLVHIYVHKVLFSSEVEVEVEVELLRQRDETKDNKLVRRLSFRQLKFGYRCQVNELEGKGVSRKLKMKMKMKRIELVLRSAE